ncbi:CDP-glucose 4,6-dehydratase [Nitratireductor aquibiodomus]|uniref:CDP-glucose 4,6-dehydratase n=1 Tax=Nitratireductor aquibiodomus TaxID=204799 RepID=UPI001FCE2B98|nr:CDP-glucose 4,6-dehydratase [Nitratireductor aquibiodomus]
MNTSRETLPFEQPYAGRRVLVTGHTGFTGGWLCSWLDLLGARVAGLGLSPLTDRNLFETLNIAERVSSHMGNINHPETVNRLFESEKPEIVFHLAAQPIVSEGYSDPYNTFMTNVIGTLNVLEAARNCAATRAVVCVTTDKVYENREWCYGYREHDRLGGKDPYSASKAGSEVVIATYQQTMAARGNDVAIASARGGNIIGGGDWSPNRIVPDFARALEADAPLVLRNPSATRPWQHVLALVHGYLVLAERLLADRGAVGAWNFGPEDEGNQPVSALVEALGRHWRPARLEYGTGAFPEAHFLHLSSQKAKSGLGWKPPLSFDETVRLTGEWYAAHQAGSSDMKALTDRQISRYRALLGI